MGGRVGVWVPVGGRCLEWGGRGGFVVATLFTTITRFNRRLHLPTYIDREREVYLYIHICRYDAYMYTSISLSLCI